MYFILTPHNKSIIVGRNVNAGGDDVIICAAKHCLHQSEHQEDVLMNDANNGVKSLNPILLDTTFGKEIEVTGFIDCPRCKTKVLYPDNLGEFNAEHQEAVNLICPSCNKTIPLKDSSGKFTVTWTQKVYSKHRRHNHAYYHAECWDAMFRDVKDDGEQTI